ncbi:MAG TPA: hypothetical protein VHX86_02105 [Tepidisphaeraceae bacterium]|jgi:hypothetical protein|nr:hypothetical protein [Tepidisphaeraceae bacterium]
MKAQLTGMCGVYLVAAELSRRGFIASPTSRSAAAADILVTDQACRRAFTVQVKTNSGASSFWLVGKPYPGSETHIYVLVNLKAHGGGSFPEYFVVPSKIINERTYHQITKATSAEFYSVQRNEIRDYQVLPNQDKWKDIFGDPYSERNVEEESTSEKVHASADTVEPK